MAIVEETVQISAAEPLPGFLARPGDADPHPAVVIIYEVFGLTNNIRNVARRLAETGYVALAPDFFREAPTPYEDFARAREVAARLSDEGAMKEVRHALDFLDGHPGVLEGRAAIMGFCMGGRLACEERGSFDPAAAAAWARALKLLHETIGEEAAG